MGGLSLRPRAARMGCGWEETAGGRAIEGVKDWVSLVGGAVELVSLGCWVVAILGKKEGGGGK